MVYYIVISVFTVAFFAVTVVMCKGLKLNVRAQALGGIVCAITVLLSAIIIPLPTGCSISAGSMIPIMLLALCYDHRLAFVTGWVTGLVVMVLIPVWQPVHWGQVFTEHLVCFSCLGYAGVFGWDKRWKALCGAVLSVVIVIVSHTLSGVVFYSQNAWDGWGAFAYSATYNLSAFIPEGILSIVVLMAVPVRTIRRLLNAPSENRT